MWNSVRARRWCFRLFCRRLRGGDVRARALLALEEFRLVLFFFVVQREFRVWARAGGFESRSESGGLGRIRLSRRLLEFGLGLVHALQLRLHEFSRCLIHGDGEVVHLRVLGNELVFQSQSLFLRLVDPSVELEQLSLQILFIVAANVEGWHELIDGIDALPLCVLPPSPNPPGLCAKSGPSASSS